MEAPDDIYLGSWTDWTKGPILGATLTVTRRDGTLFIAFLAFFVALVGTRFWRIVCVVLYYAYSEKSPSDGVHHQRQALLRNAPNPEAALWTISNMGISWRNHARRLWNRLLPPFGMALACIVGFTLASGFSSRVAALSGAEVLLQGKNCSFLPSDRNMSTYGDTEGPYLTAAMISAEAYARRCYGNTRSNIGCNIYVKKALPPKVLDTDAECPFDRKLCKSQRGNLYLDTGLLDSLHDFGRNTPPNQRIQWRRTLKCAPLATDGYRFTTFDSAKNQSYTTYYYGPMKNVDGTTTVNYTTQFNTNVYPEIEELTHDSGDTVRDFSVR
jgi:hypothetical protein